MSNYWEKRIASDTWTTYNNLEEKNRALLEMYQDSSRAISEELYTLTEKMQTATPSLSDMHKYNRLTGLRNKMESIIKDLGEGVESFGKENMCEGFKDTYSNVMAKLGKLEFDEVPKKVMEEMLNRPWQGGTFSERLWKNTQVLASNLNEILVNGLAQGKTVTEMSIQLNNAMNNGFNVSHRLIRTETMHYLNESAFKGYEDAGCEEVELWAAEDERTCEICGSKHGTKYKIKDRPILPLHANCRCTYLPVIDIEDKKTLVNEEVKISKKEDINQYSVNRKLVNSKEYHDKFEELPLSKQSKENLYVESKKILEHRDGTKYEDLVVLDAKSGKEIVSNRVGHQDRKTGLSKKDYEMILNYKDEIILLHNHPGGGRLSGTDIISMFKENNVSMSMAVGHDGSVHYIYDMNRKINIEEIYNEEYNQFKRYYDNNVASKKATDVIYSLNIFKYYKG